jgi:hypothetical protein
MKNIGTKLYWVTQKSHTVNESSSHKHVLSRTQRNLKKLVQNCKESRETAPNFGATAYHKNVSSHTKHFARKRKKINVTFCGEWSKTAHTFHATSSHKHVSSHTKVSLAHTEENKKLRYQTLRSEAQQLTHSLRHHHTNTCHFTQNLPRSHTNTDQKNLKQPVWNQAQQLTQSVRHHQTKSCYLKQNLPGIHKEKYKKNYGTSLYGVMRHLLT